MPGIVGIIGHGPATDCENLVRSMVGSMRHERFYSSGTYSVPQLGVYAGWVAHDDSFAAGQPFLNEQRDIALIFSGECFMDPKTPANLRRKGGEIGNNNGWLVHLYEEDGERFPERLNGLFSGLLIDQRQKKAFLFNDRYGSERIYWHETSDAVYFASEAKALLSILPELRAFDEQGVAQFLTYGCTVEGRTLFRDIRLLPGASLWSFEGRNRGKKTYFFPAIWESQPLLLAEPFEAKFQETFKRILPRYLKGESGIGISLTGGLDTRMIMACLPDTNQKPLCYTFSGSEGETLDDRLAARVARTCGLEHRLLRLGADFFSDFASYADRTVYITDGCFGITGAHEIYFNKQARDLAPVRLTGNYGSEILRGVSTFKPLKLSSNLLSSRFDSTLNPWTGAATKENQHPITFSAFRDIHWNLFGSLAASRSQVTFRTPYLDNEIVALAYQAPLNLRTSPVPAWRLVRANSALLSEIPTDRRPSPKSSRAAGMLRRVFSEATFKLDYINNERWPHWLSPVDPLFRRLGRRTGILGLHKFLHYRSWFRRELAGYLQDVVAQARSRQSPFWNAHFLERMVNEQVSGRKNYVHELNAVLTLEAVERLLLQDLAHQPREREDPRIPIASLATAQRR
jgi:asparagine synthase (glutamine-hydrolysing)